MKKNYFLLLCSVLMSVCLLGTSCSEDEPAPAPSFPAKITKTAVAGEVIEISFEANYNWTATISENAYTYFQLLNGETTTNTVSGPAGSSKIRVNVADITVYENAPVADVTLTMDGQEAVIATITYPTTAREFAVYAPVVNEWGAFTEEFATEPLAADAALPMNYGSPVLGEDGVVTFYTPAKVVANYAYTLVGPSWMKAIEAGEAGQTQYIFQADPAKIPANTEVAKIDVLIAGTDTVATSFNVKVTGADEFLSVEGFINGVYGHDGKAVGTMMMSGFISSSENVVIKAYDTTGAEASWLTLSPAAWDKEGDKIQYRLVMVSKVNQNEGDMRKAFIFIFPNGAAPSDDVALIKDGEPVEAYANSVVATVVQHSTPAEISVNSLDDSCTTFAKASSDIDYWFTEGALRDLYLGNKYDISYFGQWAEYGSDSSFKTNRPIDSHQVYSYNAAGNFVEITETSWVTLKTFYNSEEMSRFKLTTDFNAASAEGSLNVMTGEYEAVVLVKYTDGTYSAIYFHYSEKKGGSSEGLAFANPDYAAMAQATLVELSAGDELYDTYFAEYSSEAMPAKFYHLTYAWPLDTNMYSMVSLTGIPEGMRVRALNSWLSFDSENQSIVMAKEGAAESAPGAVTVVNDMGVNDIVILCTLLSAE